MGQRYCQRCLGFDEKVFRLGSCRGENQNLVVWVTNSLKKSELPNNLTLRDNGEFLMVSLGPSHRGKGTLRFAPAGTKVNAATYLEIIENSSLPDRPEMYGVPPDCVFQQYGASSLTTNIGRDFRKKRLPLSRDTSNWSSNSPDLNPLDFFASVCLQSQVGKKEAFMP